MLSTAIDKQWKWPKCPWTKDWINKIWYVQAMKYYSIIKRNELLTYYNINEAWNTMKAITKDHVLYEWNVTICSDFRAQEEEGLLLKLKLQYSGHVMQTTDSSGKTLLLGKIEGRRRRGQRRMRMLDGINDSMDMNLGKLREIVRDRDAWCAAVHAVRELDVT